MALLRFLALTALVNLIMCDSSSSSRLCADVKAAISRQYEISDEPYDNPRVVSEYSACYGMQVTCCPSYVEKKAIPQVQTSLLDDLQKVLDEAFGASCARIGSHFGRGLFEMLTQTQKLLTDEVGKVFDTDSSEQWSPFNQLFKFLQEFQYTHNFCMLNNVTIRTVRELVEFAAKDYPNPTEINVTRVEQHFISLWSKKIHNSMLGYLYYLRNIKEALEAVDTFFQMIRQHQFSSSTLCTNAVMRMYHCGLCAGHTTTLSCEGNCINTYRGCFADAAEVRPVIKDFSEQLRRFAMLSMSDFQTITFIEGALMDYIQLSYHIAEADFTQISTKASMLPNEAFPGKPLPVGPTRLNLSQPHDHHHHLRNAFNQELECAAKNADSLLEIPEGLCGVNPKHLDYIRNVNCWNGTAQGSYQGSLVGHMIKDQLHNPSFTKEEQQVLGQRSMGYQEQLDHLNNSLTEINKYIHLYDCLSSNDEDCAISFQSECFHEEDGGGTEPIDINPTDHTLQTEPTENQIEGSGYGSASEAYSGDGGDTEEVALPTLPEEFDTYNPDAHTWTHRFVVKLIPPFIRDSASDIQSTEGPPGISPAGSVVLPSPTANPNRPSLSTRPTTIEPSNQARPGHRPAENDVGPTRPEADGKVYEKEDDVVIENMPDSQLLISNPSGSSSSLITGGMSLVSISIITSIVLKWLTF